MIRSRLIFILLFLAYLGVTPAGVYTCACLVAPQPGLEEVQLGEIPDQASVMDTAVASLITFFSLSFAIAVTFWPAGCQKQDRLYEFVWLIPTPFCEPPPTPPPHFA